MKTIDRRTFRMYDVQALALQYGFAIFLRLTTSLYRHITTPNVESQLNHIIPPPIYCQLINNLLSFTAAWNIPAELQAVYMRTLPHVIRLMVLKLDYTNCCMVKEHERFIKALWASFSHKPTIQQNIIYSLNINYIKLPSIAWCLILFYLTSWAPSGFTI